MPINLDAKIAASQALITRALDSARNPALMWSGGKDSMVLLQLVKTESRKQKAEMRVIHHRDGDRGPQWDFADRIIEDWELTPLDYWPLARAVKQRGDRIETVTGYDVGNGQLLHLPKNLFEGDDEERKACGLMWLQRPRAWFAYPWDLILHGHKSSDVDEMDGPVPLKSEWVERDGLPTVVFPLRDWTDADIWAYSRAHHVPQDEGRYGRSGTGVSPVSPTHSGTGILPVNRSLNNDYRDMCVRCLDLNAPELVPCPKTGTLVHNVSRRVCRADDVALPAYIEKEQHVL